MKRSDTKLIPGILICLGTALILSLSACNSQSKKAEKTVDNYLQKHLNEIFPNAQSVQITDYGKLTEVFDSIPQNDEYMRCDSLIELYDSLETAAEKAKQQGKIKAYTDSLGKYIDYQEHLDPQKKLASLGYQMEVSAKVIDARGKEDIYHLSFDFLTPTELWSYKANGQERMINEE